MYADNKGCVQIKNYISGMWGLHFFLSSLLMTTKKVDDPLQFKTFKKVTAEKKKPKGNPFKNARTHNGGQFHSNKKYISQYCDLREPQVLRMSFHASFYKLGWVSYIIFVLLCPPLHNKQW